jgi:nucleotide-binding universal stress UspA family protein
MWRMSAAFQHLTVPVDGSSTAERGVAFGIELARGGGSLTFCSVVDPTLVCLPLSYGVAIDPGPMLTALDDNADTFCRQAQEEARRDGVPADISVLHGQCVAAIESLVRENGSQAIVIGTHGRTGLTRGLLGSVAEGLLRHSDVPVIAVHEGDVARTGPIAVALDESPAAHTALEIATAIAAARGIPLVLVHARSRGDDASRIDALLAGAEKRVRARGVTVRSVVRDGVPAATLLATTDELECCMVVMGTHGRPSFETMVIGSVAQSLIERARVPVVAVRRAIAA